MSSESTAVELEPFNVPAGTAVGAAMRELNYPNKGDDAVVCVQDANGELKDLSHIPDADATFMPVAANTELGRSVIRHSAAHVLAQAVQAEFPGTKLGIGPAIDDGFYYDFDVAEPFTPDDLVTLEKRMKKIIKQGQKFVRGVYQSVEEAAEDLKDEPYKLELIQDKGNVDPDSDEATEVGAGDLTHYDNVNPRTGEVEWHDLCRGPHVPTTKYIPAFALTRSSAAYWRGDQNNAGLQRIYGTAWESKERLDEHLHMLREAEKRDHRRLGNEMDLFSFPDELGSGLPVFHPDGGIIRLAMEDHSRRRHIEAGYSFVNTPHVTKGSLFSKSGHLDWYADGMFPPMKLDGEIDDDGNVVKQPQDYYVKPMNCPMHNLIFDSRGRSYRELPLRLFEFGTVYRYEKSGVIHGLTRARGFTQDDAHIYCTEDQLEAELTSVLEFIISLLKDYGLNDFYLELSTKDPQKYIGDDEIWQRSTDILQSVAEKSGLELVPDPAGAAFYGPKISVQARDAIGRTWQMSTVQLDFNLPERFDLTYTASDGTKKRPVMIHRALFGSIERFFGVLLEHYAGAFPAWLAPHQVVGIPVADDFAGHLDSVTQKLRERGIRAEVDHSDDRMQKKIRNHTTSKVPFMLLAGARDVEADAVSFRFLDGTQVNGVPVAEAVDIIDAWVSERINEQPSEETVAARRGKTGSDYVDTGVGTPDHLERLWAPYRSTYITSQPSGGRSKDPFLEAPQLSDEDGLIVARGETVYALLNLYPYNSGHLMVVPYRKVAELEELTARESAELMEFAQKAVRALKAVSRPEAINVGLNLGKASGGSVGDHVHLHVVPRWAGDANFMTVIGETKVLPQLLKDTRALLAQAWPDDADDPDGNGPVGSGADGGGDA